MQIINIIWNTLFICKKAKLAYEGIIYMKRPDGSL